MKFEIVGYEGSRDSKGIFSVGCAVIKYGEDLINPILGYKQNYNETIEENSNHITLLDKSIEIERKEFPRFILEIDKNIPLKFYCLDKNYIYNPNYQYEYYLLDSIDVDSNFIKSALILLMYKLLSEKYNNEINKQFFRIWSTLYPDDIVKEALIDHSFSYLFPNRKIFFHERRTKLGLYKIFDSLKIKEHYMDEGKELTHAEKLIAEGAYRI